MNDCGKAKTCQLYLRDYCKNQDYYLLISEVTKDLIGKEMYEANHGCMQMFKKQQMGINWKNKQYPSKDNG